MRARDVRNVATLSGVVLADDMEVDGDRRRADVGVIRRYVGIGAIRRGGQEFLEVGLVR